MTIPSAAPDDRTPSAASGDSTPSAAEAAGEASPRVRLPGVATALLVISPVFLFFGAVHFMATGPRGYFDNAQNQAVVGLVIFGVGVGFLLAGLVLVGVRTIAQQQLDLLRSMMRLSGARALEQDPAGPSSAGFGRREEGAS